jgi:hypothetical protein
VRGSGPTVQPAATSNASKGVVGRAIKTVQSKRRLTGFFHRLQQNFDSPPECVRLGRS